MIRNSTPKGEITRNRCCYQGHNNKRSKPDPGLTALEEEMNCLKEQRMKKHNRTGSKLADGRCPVREPAGNVPASPSAPLPTMPMHPNTIRARPWQPESEDVEFDD